jgi:perosamine synthetase
MIPYGKQSIDDEDIRAVVEVLKSDWLTTGPKVDEFEQAFARYVGSRTAVAVNSGTAALHAAMFALDIEPGDEVIVPAITFAATANCVVYQGGTPVFADVDPDTLLIDPDSVKAKVTPKTRAVVGVDYAGQPANYDRLREITERHGLALIADACHAVGATDRNRPVGTLADLSTFSFHPVKHMTTGEGGMVTTSDPQLAQKIKVFRNHGITSDHRQRSDEGSWFYEMVSLGYNYRLSDLQCALGLAQLKKIPRFLSARQKIARQYDEAFASIEPIMPLAVRSGVAHAYHLYVIKVPTDRTGFFKALRALGIGANVHYIPVHLHPYYRKHLNTRVGQCPVAEEIYHRIISLPIFPEMLAGDIHRVIEAVRTTAGQTTSWND